MSIDALGTGEEGDFDLEFGGSDTIADGLKGLGSLLMVPFWEAQAALQYCFLPLHCGEYGQETYRAAEYAKRFFIALVAVPMMLPTLPLAMLSYPLTGLACLFQSQDYSYKEGRAEEKTSGPTKVFHLNTCMFYGGLPYSYGGVRPASERFDRLVESIQEKDPDILFLCEFNRMLSDPMTYALKDQYSHFFFDIGLNLFGMENCLFVASRCPIVSTPQYIPFEKPPQGDQRFIRRGFFAFETEDRWYLYTHLHPRSEEFDREMRQDQLDKIQQFIDNETHGKTCILLGDLNINSLASPDTDYQKMLARGFTDPFKEQYPDEFTGGDLHNAHIYGEDETQPNSAIDYVLVRGNASVEMEIFDTYEDPLDEALSDHRGLIAIISSTESQQDEQS